MPTNYSEISKFWNDNPCFGGNQTFPFKSFKNRKVLEIGCGGGMDALRFVNNGAIYTGIDLTEEAVIITKKKVGNEGVVLQMNAENLDFPDNYFDIVYSFGVIHHTINPEKVLKEVYRVLKPNGYIFLMLYNKFSWRYLIEIQILRRILWWCKYYKFNHIRQFIPYPTPEQWISINTDNIGCPWSRVYTKRKVEELLKDFKITMAWTENWGWFRNTIGQKL